MTVRALSSVLCLAVGLSGCASSEKGKEAALGAKDAINMLAAAVERFGNRDEGTRRIVNALQGVARYVGDGPPRDMAGLCRDFETLEEFTFELAKARVPMPAELGWALAEIGKACP